MGAKERRNKQKRRKKGDLFLSQFGEGRVDLQLFFSHLQRAPI
jgi:hypothetical protein